MRSKYVLPLLYDRYPYVPRASIDSLVSLDALRSVSGDSAGEVIDETWRRVERLMAPYDYWWPWSECWD